MRSDPVACALMIDTSNMLKSGKTTSMIDTVIQVYMKTNHKHVQIATWLDGQTNRHADSDKQIDHDR